MLKIQSRLYERTLNSSIALRNGLISLLDQTFPGANKLFDEQRTKAGHIKWVDFVRRFWHKDCMAASSLSTFADTFQKWCKRTGYHYSLSDAERIHGIARNSVATLTKNDSTKLIITQAVDSLNAVYDTLHGDYISGAARMLEAFVTAAAIAIGVGLGMLLLRPLVR